MSNIVKMRDILREAADIIDEVLELEKRDEEGQDVEKELESVMGRFFMKLLEIQKLSN